MAVRKEIKTMEKLFRMVFALSLVIGMVGGTTPVIFAQQAEEAVVPEIAEAIEEAKGEVVSIDTALLSIGVKSLTGDESQDSTTSNYYLSGTSEIKKDDQVINLADLKEGDSVVIQYTLGEGWKRVVKSIVVVNN